MLVVFFSALLAFVHAEYSFLSIADWGGSRKPPYYSKGQKSSAKGMNNIMNKLDVDTILALGDNFYSRGVTKKTVKKRFEDTLESVYSGNKFKDSTFYAIAGNHDHKGDVDAQISMHGKVVPMKWHFPSQWYTFQKSFTGWDGSPITIDFVMIDTVELAGESFYDEKKLMFVRATGPLSKHRQSTQYRYINKLLSESTADFLFVAGHYPVWSVCSHGPTDELLATLKPLMKKYGVTAYLSGHDHCASYIDEGDGGPVYPLQGMGMECCYSSRYKDYVEQHTPANSIKFYIDSHKASKMNRAPLAGFASYTMDLNGLVTKIYDDAGNIMFTSDPVPRRNLGSLRPQANLIHNPYSSSYDSPYNSPWTVNFNRAVLTQPNNRNKQQQTCSGKQCHFPFLYKGTLYYSCISDPFHDLNNNKWCCTKLRCSPHLQVGEWDECCDESNNSHNPNQKLRQTYYKSRQIPHYVKIKYNLPTTNIIYPKQLQT